MGTDKPGKVQAIAIMSLVSGILSVIVGISWLMAGLSWLIVGVVFTIVPAAYLMITGIMNIVYASKMIGSNVSVSAPAKYLAILDIVSVLFCNFVPMVLGIINLVFYADPEVEGFFQKKAASIAI